MSLVDREFQLGETIEVQRAFVLSHDAFAGIKDVPHQFVKAVRGFAGEEAVVGIAAVIGTENQDVDLRVIHNLPQDDFDSRVRFSLHSMNLRLLKVESTWVNMKGRPFEEVEEEIRQEVSANPKAMLAGIFKFTD